MLQQATYISILSLLLINELRAQTGDGCFLKTCPEPGQVRIDAVVDAHNNFLGGCQCECHPGKTDPTHPLFCEEPNVLNWDERTRKGDCSCSCDPNTPRATCTFPQVYVPSQCGCGCPSYAPDPSSCKAPQEFNPALCQCACDIGSVQGPCISNGKPVPMSKVNADCTCDASSVQCAGNQSPNPTTGACECPSRAPNGAWYPSCTHPLAKDPVTCDCIVPTTTIPPVGDIDVTCSTAGDCSCPYGTAGICTINCNGGGDACKDGLIECNNNGYDCIVNCMASGGCAGAASIEGPVGGALKVTCGGSNACEGAVHFDGSKGTDMTVICDGGQSCKGGSIFAFGSGAAKLQCNGPMGGDTCSGGVTFSLLPNARTTPGASFECTGLNCPHNAPLSFSIPLPGSHGVPGASTPANPATPGSFPGTGTGNLPPPGVGAGGGTVIINTAQPIPVVLPPEIVICQGTGVTCKCAGNRACTIKCEDPDSCKESVLQCPPAHDCTVVCMEKSCQTATVNGPLNADFTANCPGLGSCTDTTFNSDGAKDVAFTCSGKDACKGASHINCGQGVCDVACSGESSCDGAKINPNAASSFQCSGHHNCPANFTPQPVPVPTEPPTVFVPCGGMGDCPCYHDQCFMERDINEGCGCVCPTAVLLKEMSGDPMCGDATHQVYDHGACACSCPPNAEPLGGCKFGQTFNTNTCQCECPGGNECPGAGIKNLETCRCECPSHSPTASDCSAVGKVLRYCECACPIPCQGDGQIQSPNTCACGCPFGTPTAALCESGIVDHLACACAPPLPSTFCCKTSVPNFKPWAGRCWGEQTESGCEAQPNARCTWNANDCHPGKFPINDMLPNQACFFRDNSCTANEQCCSEVCKIDGLCR